MTLWAGLGWLAIVVVPALLGLGLVWLAARRRADDKQTPGAQGAGGAWEFLPEKYRGMDELLGGEGLAYLQSRRGFRPEMAARWRRERYQIFRMYLRELKHDFRRLHARARALVSLSDAASSSLVGVLMRQEVVFLWALMALEVRLLLYRAGIGSVSLVPLVELLESMRLDLAAYAS